MISQKQSFKLLHHEYELYRRLPLQFGGAFHKFSAIGSRVKAVLTVEVQYPENGRGLEECDLEKIVESRLDFRNIASLVRSKDIDIVAPLRVSDTTNQFRNGRQIAIAFDYRENLYQDGSGCSPSASMNSCMDIKRRFTASTWLFFRLATLVEPCSSVTTRMSVG